MQATLDPLLVEWLPLGGLAGPLQPGTRGRQYLLAEGDPDVWVEPASKGWLRVQLSSRGNLARRPEIEGRFDIVQRWIALFLAPARAATREGATNRFVLPTLVSAPRTPFSTRQIEDFTTLLLEDGEVVARLSDYSPQGALIPHTPKTNRLTHVVYWPLPFLLEQLDLAAQREGGILHRSTERWPPRRVALTKRAKWDLWAEQSRREADRLRSAAQEATGL